MSENIIRLNSVDQYCQLFGLPDGHPLIRVVDLKDATRWPTHFTIHYGVYALFLKDTRCGDIRYGKQTYDYQEGTVTSFAQGQVVETIMEEGTRPKALGLLFHPDLIQGTALAREIMHERPGVRQPGRANWAWHIRREWHGSMAVRAGRASRKGRAFPPNHTNTSCNNSLPLSRLQWCTPGTAHSPGSLYTPRPNALSKLRQFRSPGAGSA